MNLSMLALSVVLSVGQQAAQPAMAPDFSAKGSDGKTHTLKSLTAGDRTVVLYFIQSTCPVNADAIAYYKQIAANYKDNKKVALVGVIDEDEAGYKEWMKQFDAKFTVLYDPELEVIRSYKAMASPWIIEVNPKGEMAAVQRGYSAQRLRELNALMAKAGGVAAGKLDTSGAPASEQFG
jgi:peroxiredoxin